MNDKKFKVGMRVMICPKAYQKIYDDRNTNHWIFEPGWIGIIKYIDPMAIRLRPYGNGNGYQEYISIKVEFNNGNNSFELCFDSRCLVSDE